MNTSIMKCFATAGPRLAVAIGGLLIAAAPLSAQERSTEEKETRMEQQRRHLDRELEQLERAKAHLQAQKNINWKKVEDDVKRAMEKASLAQAQAQLEVEAAMKRIDFDGIQRQVTEAMESAAIDEHFSKEKQAAMKEAIEKAKLEMNRSGEKNRNHQLRAREEMNRVHKEMEEVHSRMQQIRPNIERSMRKAEKELERAHQELKEQQEMLEQMEADKLIDTKEDYSIELTEGKLIINGKEQPESVYARYKKYYKRSTLLLKKQNGNFVIPQE